MAAVSPRRPNRYAIFAVGIVAQIVFSAAFLGLPAASLLLGSSLQLSAGELALLLGAASIAVVFVETPWGIAADRFGERRVLLVGISGTVVALLSLALAVATGAPLWLWAVLLFVAAAAGGAVTGPSGSAILGWFGERRHGTLLSLRVAAVPVGGAVGTVVYAALFGAAPPFVAFATFAALCAGCAALVWFFVFDPARGSAVAGSGASAFRSSGVWRVASSGFLLDVTQFLVLTFSVVMLVELHGLSAAAGVAIVTAMQLGGGLLRVVIGVATDVVPRFSRSLAVRMLAVLQALGLLAFFLLPESSPVFASVLLLVVGVASCAWQGAHFTQIAALAGPRAAGSALGLNNAATSLGAFVPQVLTGLIVQLGGWGVALLGLGVVPAVVAAFLFPAVRRVGASDGPLVAEAVDQG